MLFGGGLAVLLQQAAGAPLSLQVTLEVVLLSALIPPALEGLAVLERTIYRRGLRATWAGGGTYPGDSRDNAGRNLERAVGRQAVRTRRPDAPIVRHAGCWTRGSGQPRGAGNS